MTVEEVALIILRIVGVLWILGAVFLMRQLWFNSRLDPMIEQLDRLAKEMGAPGSGKKLDIDNGRERWMAAGGVIMLAAGIAMGLGHRLAVALLAAMVVQQLLYFLRQRRRELNAADAGDAVLERPSRQTVNAFFFSLGVTVLAGWLYWRGALS